MILMMYNQKVCKEFLLPNIHDADETIYLPHNIFGLKKDLVLYLEKSMRGWELKTHGEYEIEEKKIREETHLLQDGDILDIITAERERFQVIAAENSLKFQVMEKYDLSMMKEVSIGGNNGNLIQYQFRELVSASHAVLKRHSDGWYVSDLSRNGIFCANRRISGRQKLNMGDRLDIFGLHLIFLGDQLAVGNFCGEKTVKEDILRPIQDVVQDSGKKQAGRNHRDDTFHRSPRHLPVIYREKVEIEAPPSPKVTKQKPLLLTIGPAFTMAIPMMLGCGFAIFGSRLSGQTSGAFMYTGLITAVTSALIGVVWAVTNLNYSKKENEEEENQRFNAYSNYLIQTADMLREKYRQNTAALLQMYPSAEECMKYNQNSSELWNRNYTHGDFLYQRVGTGDQPFQVEIQVPKEKFTLINDTLLEKPGMIRREFELLHHVPVGISLLEKRLIGLVGGDGKKGAVEMMHVLAAGIAAAHCYTDVKMVFLYREQERERQQDWECMRWFPHVWSEDKSTRYMASNEIETADILFELSNIIRRRSQSAGSFQGNERKRVEKPHYVLFVSDPEILEGELLSKYIYEARPEYGLTTFLMVEHVEELPNECEEVIENDVHFQGIYNLLDTEHEKTRMAPDKADRNRLAEFGKTLANIHVNEVESTSEIPARLDFLEMYGVQKPEELNAPERWRKNRTYNSMKALIGRKSGNADCYLDIHEKFHGPHGLVAGTTGSGKSETLQTYILSLAVNFGPEDVSFFIIDFKGGGMANLFSGLPHLAGQISNLSGNQVRRAMISIKSENMRRQRLFSEYGVNNINLYTRLYKNHEADVPIPHLFIIIDEFAELKREEPEFMKELISVAQVGRSLGVHLILATQKPGGTVDDNIWSNSKFRLCLRVQDRQDSNDMLHKPDAAFLTQAGRGYLQVGNDEIYELFQSGYSGAIYDDSVRQQAQGAAMLNRTGKAELTGVRSTGKVPAKEKGVRETTQLEAVIAYLTEVAKEQAVYQKKEQQKPMQLWLPVLSENLYLEEIRECKAETESGEFAAKVGMYDDPQNQVQKALYVDFMENGHLAVCGSVVSGKSTFLQTLVYSLLHNTSPDELQLYLIDFSSHMLAPFEKAPHVGGVVFDSQEDRLAKLMHMLMGIMDDRKRQLQGGNYSQYLQTYKRNRKKQEEGERKREAGEEKRLPAILVVIDNIASMREKSRNAYDDQLLRISREGVGYGIFLVVSAAGFGMAEIPTRIGDNIRTVISLEQADKFKYMEVMRQTRLEILPENGVKGRGLAVADGRVLEFQTARCMKAEDDFERGRQIEAQCGKLRACWRGACAKPIPEIPEKPMLSQFSETSDYQAALWDTRRLPLGYRMEDASVYSVNLADIYCYAITGKDRTGKTNVLKVLLHAAAQKSGKICVVERGTQELKKYAQKYRTEYVSDCRGLFDYLSVLLPEFARRNKKKHMLLENGVEEEELFAAIQEENPIFLFLADVGEFMRMVYKPDEGVKNMSGFVENMMEKGRDHRIYVIGCLRVEDETALISYRAYNAFAGYKKGVHVGGNLSSQKLFSFQNIPFSEQSKSEKKGIAIVPDEEEESVGIKIVIPHVKNQNDSHVDIG